MGIHPFLAAVGCFVFSRIYYWTQGVRFDVFPLLWFYQFVDPQLLKHSLASSLLYLHTQPPLFNFLLGLFLKFASQWLQLAFSIFYLVLGSTLLWLLFKLQIQMGVNRWIASFVSALFCITPSCVLYENWLFYTYPVAVLLLAAAFFLFRSVSTVGILHKGLLFLILSLCVLTRTSYHLIWFVGIVLTVVLLQRAQARQFLYAAIIPFLIIVSINAKNLYLFGQFNSSTMLGISLFKTAIHNISSEEKLQMVREGKISRLALVEPNAWVAGYETQVPQAETGVAVLDQKVKSTGFNNYNHNIYMRISRQQIRDALTIVRLHPGRYLKSVFEAFEIYFWSSSDTIFLKRNKQKIEAINSLTDRLLFGNFSGHPDGPYWTLFLGIPILIIYSVPKILFLFKQEARATAMTLLFISSTIVYAMVVGNLVEFGENNRFRFEVDPYFAVLAGLFLQDLYCRIRIRSLALDQQKVKGKRN